MKQALWILTLLASLGIGGCAARLPDLPTPISNNAVASVIRPDGSWSVVSFMGITDPEDVSTITPAAYRLDSGARAWRRVRDAPLHDGRARIGASAVAVRGSIYLIGGYSVLEDGSEVTEKRLFRYEPAEDRYVELAPVPVEVDDTLAGVYADRYIVLVSGWHGPAHDNVNDVQVYDTIEDTWRSATPLPGRPLFGHAGGISGRTILVMDGVARGEGGFEMSDAVHVGTIDPLDPTRIAWETIEPHPGEATYRAACTTTMTNEGAIVVLGGSGRAYNISGTGYDGAACAPLAQMLVFDPETRRTRSVGAPAGWHATMDHRGLAPIGDGRWITVGGMRGPGEADHRAQIVRVGSSR
ncbi:MAG: Kelch repeat-containing protein [Phycisphaerales bacterium JB059]